MQTSKFQTIFYPDQVQKRENVANKSIILPSSLLVPHASYEWIGEDLYSGYSLMDGCSCRLVVVLSALHQSVIKSEEGHLFFIPTGEGFSLGDRTIRYAEVLRNKITSTFSLALQEDCYFSEEPSVELQLPMIAAYFPTAAVLPILCSSSMDSKETKALALLLSFITENEKNTLFVISGNASALGTAESALEKTKALDLALRDGGQLLELRHQGRIDSCATSIIEAMNRQPWNNGKWKIASYSCLHDRFNKLPDTYAADRKVVWHIVATLEGESSNV
ncbi:MAG: AmmeMemoRadiSam system protein B [Sphaerochaetaceae bacterium]